MRHFGLVSILLLTACQAESLTTPTPTATPDPEIPLTWAVKRAIPHQVEWNGSTYDITITWLLLQEWHNPFSDHGTVTETVCDVQSSQWTDPVIGNEFSFNFPSSWYAGSRTWGLEVFIEEEDMITASVFDQQSTAIGGDVGCTTLQDGDGDGQPGNTFYVSGYWVHGCYSEGLNGYHLTVPTDTSRSTSAEVLLKFPPTWNIVSEVYTLTGLTSSSGRYLNQQYQALSTASCNAVISAQNIP